MPVSRAIAPLLAGVLIISGCGPAGNDSSGDFSGPKEDVASAIENLESAGRSSDEAKICTDLLAPALIDRIRASGASCTQAISDAIDDADTFDLDVKSVTVTGAKASAVVKSKEKDATDTFRLAKVGGQWKIESLG